MPSAVLADAQNHKASQLFKILGDPTRLHLLYLIANETRSRLCCVDLSESLNISAPTVTHHMKKLEAVNLVFRRKHGKWTFYEVNRTEFNKINKLVNTL
ncbi:ArsR-family transcriptional regulator [Corynebacterium kutscheri]|uniref:ArsR-family transcriptional regulator n=1 Tax=Corynebacterium kutscheri TaxID=35755 RepID=A0A0F6TCL9_9CORY|nr:metalloregulator ArsR/SmtB family transcription factor [Corynebacterium kutscheri]AKE40496.1 putative transcriptional regulator [Corynebacterium kutscheri]VEH05087.1 ArsR-family transcriptional regulator [Corynebacterium kutscheri]VEH10891.1 ArsR-family transcriptional regulator [Corynebacterium kutscheri]VEH80632.1 ArsR-family transcriptional regulator [Corynebacterium kutscheri]